MPFTILTFLVVRSGSPSDVRQRPVLVTTLATISGPFVGAIARNGQACCLGFSLSLAKLCGPFLALGLITQVIPLPFRRVWEAARLASWTIGWLVWFAGGLVSFGHALS